MNLHGIGARRALAATAAVGAAVLGPAIALASPGGQSNVARIATPACATSGLDVWLDTQGSGAAGHTYYNLEFTNLSGSSCTLYGYPGVSGVTLGGTQLGAAAIRVGGTPHTVTLANGATAFAFLGITDAGVISPPLCHEATAAGLRVYPPSQTQSRTAPFPFQACSKSGTVYLSIGLVQS
jgi:uncharacterized protein DUF4232